MAPRCLLAVMGSFDQGAILSGQYRLVRRYVKDQIDLLSLLNSFEAHLAQRYSEDKKSFLKKCMGMASKYCLSIEKSFNLKWGLNNQDLVTANTLASTIR